MAHLRALRIYVIELARVYGALYNDMKEVDKAKYAVARCPVGLKEMKTLVEAELKRYGELRMQDPDAARYPWLECCAGCDVGSVGAVC